MEKMKLVPVSLVALALAITSQAEEIGNKSATTMQEVVVTATRTETATSNVGGSSVAVLTSEQIENKQQSTAEELIKGILGIDVVANGGPGTQSAVFVRGADSKNTLVLVDGVMLNDTSSTNRLANLADITSDNIERIEVVKGPMSVLYGSNATAGVINIITKTGKGDPSVNVAVEGGSYNSWKLSGDVSGSNDSINYSLAASTTRTDGFSIANDDNGRIAHGGNTSENDGWENVTFSAKTGIEFAPGFKIDGVVRYMKSSVDIDDAGAGFAGDRFDGGWPPFPQPTLSKEAHGNSDQLIFRINGHNVLFGDKFISDISYQSTTIDRQNYDNDGMPSWDYKGDSNELGWQGQVGFGDHDLLVGASFYTEEMNSIFGGISDKKADVRSFFVQDQLMIGDSIDIVAGARMDDHDRFGNEITWKIAPAYFVEKTDTQLRASYGTGFRAPSLFELYSSYGNQNLEAETSKGYDAGFEQTLQSMKISFGATYFNTVFENRIDYDFTTWVYNQLPGDTRVSGVETFVKWQPRADLDMTVNYTYNDTEDHNEKRLIRRPLNKVNVNCVYRYTDKAVVNLDYYWVDDRNTSPFVTDLNGQPVTTLDSYVLVNIAARYAVSPLLTVFARIDNVLGEEYEEAWSYATPGRSGYIGVKASF